MKKAFLHYLNSFENNDFHSINDFIITNLKDYQHPVIMKSLIFLDDINLISIENDTNYHLNAWVKNRKVFTQDIFSNSSFKVKITDKGRAMINNIETFKNNKDFKNMILKSSLK